MGVLGKLAKAAKKAGKKAKPKAGTQKLFADKFVSQLDEGQAPSRGTLDVEAGKAGKVTKGSRSQASMRDEGRNPARAKADVELEKTDPAAYERKIKAENKRVSEKAAMAQGKAQGAKTPVSLAGEKGKISVGGKTKLKASDMMVGNTENGITFDGVIIGNPTDNQVSTVVRNMNARDKLSAEAKRNLARLERRSKKDKEYATMRNVERKAVNTGKDTRRKYRGKDVPDSRNYNQGGMATGKPRTGHVDHRSKGLFK